MTAHLLRSWVAELGTACWCVHYAKRLLETLFVHRFSKGTMPLFNIFKNSGYYWGFAAYVAYFVCHPLYTPPRLGTLQVRVHFLTALFDRPSGVDP